MYRQNVAHFLFNAGSRIPDKESIQIVEEEYYSWIPSLKPNLYLLVQRKSWSVLRILANIEYSESCWGQERGEVWLSAQVCDSENLKYWEHTNMHWFFRIDDVDSVLSALE